jgi:hypothetical protein
VSALDRALLAERAMSVERHLARVAERLPVDPADLTASTDVSDAVILHLWQATQIVIDLAMSACWHLTSGRRPAMPTRSGGFSRPASSTSPSPARSCGPPAEDGRSAFASGAICTRLTSSATPP